MNPILKKLLRIGALFLLSPTLVFLIPLGVVFGLIQLIHGLCTFAFDGEWRWTK